MLFLHFYGILKKNVYLRQHFFFRTTHKHFNINKIKQNQIYEIIHHCSSMLLAMWVFVSSERVRKIQVGNEPLG